MRRRISAAKEDIVVKIDGVAHNEVWRYADPGEVGFGYRSGVCTWYYFDVELKPGANHVRVDTKLWASHNGMPADRILSYCLFTGGKWKGPIGRERVSIIFEGEDDLSFVKSIFPESGCKEGDRIVWEFNQIEPEGAEYDITLSFTMPDALALLKRAAEAHGSHPTDDAAAILYAQHLFLFGGWRSNGAIPPRLTEQEYARVVARFADAEATETMARYYQPAGGGGYEERAGELTDRRAAIWQLLADAGHSHETESSHVMEGKRVIEGVLARNPRNSAAWNVYLFNLWRVSFGAMGGSGPVEYTQPQREAISAALKYCPDDPGIQFWGDKLAGEARLDSAEMFEMMQKLDLHPREFLRLLQGQELLQLLGR